VLIRGPGEWRLTLGIPGPVVYQYKEMARFVELAAAFSLLGYMLAELRGRAELRFGRMTAWVLPRAAGVALAAEALRGLRPHFGASATGLVVLLASSLFGGWVYHLQRATVRRLLGLAPAEASPADAEPEAVGIPALAMAGALAGAESGGGGA
jgi:hypothetical protein